MKTTLEELERLVPLAAKIKKGADFGDAVRMGSEAAKKAEPLPKRLGRLEPMLAALATAPRLRAGEIRELLQRVDAFGQEVSRANDPQALREVRFPLQRTEEAVGQLETALANAQRAEGEAIFGPVRQLGDALAAISDTAKEGRSLSSWAAKSAALAGRGILGPTELEELKAAAAEVPARLAALERLGIDEGVRRFLAAVAQGAATLASIDGKVLAWLQEKKAAERFQVRAR